MHILVIDDSTIHQEAAKQQLKGHDTTVVGSYDAGRKLLEKEHNFDSVLVDLMMPASGHQQGRGMEFVGQEMPVGIFLVLLAAKNGAKYVAVLTDTNHHDHPTSACIDAFNEEIYLPDPFCIGEVTILLANTSNFMGSFQPEDFTKSLYCMEDHLREELEKKPGFSSVRAKDWGKLFDCLTGDRKVDEK